MAQYLHPSSDINREDGQEIFLIRTEMVNLAGNMHHNYENNLCLCLNYIETQQHIINCKLYTNVRVSHDMDYRSFFGSKIIEMKKSLQAFREIYEMRNVLWEAGKMQSA